MAGELKIDTRRKKILEVLRRDGQVRVAQLSEALGATVVTIRSDLDARGVPGRIADTAGEQAREIFDTAIEVADENRTVVGGTVAALLLWLLRNPLIDLVRRLFGPDSIPGADDKE